MTHEASAIMVEQLLRRCAMVEVVRAIEHALDHMRFAVPFEDGGPFRSKPFGRTPLRPTGPMFAGIDDARTARHREPEKIALLDALEELQRELVFSADCADITDSHNTCRGFLQAAGYVDRAAEALISSVTGTARP